MPQVHCNGLDLYYADTGHGEPLVFLNGLAGDHLYWMGQVRAFAEKCRCIAIDNRDAGRSSYATGPYTIADLADDVVTLLDVLGLPAAYLVGLSLGGMIAQEAALRHPQRVRSLFLADTLAKSDAWFMATLEAFAIIRRGVPDTPAFFDALLPWLTGHQFFQSASKVDWLRALLKQNPYPQRIDGFFRQFDAIRAHDTLERLSAIRCPVLVGVGEDDMIVPPRYSQEIAKRIPHARLEVLPGVGHAPPLEDPRRFNSLLREFLMEQE